MSDVLEIQAPVVFPHIPEGIRVWSLGRGSLGPEPRQASLDQTVAAGMETVSASGDLRKLAVPSPDSSP